ncbi:prepilin peptidase-dependent protein [Candidatus Fukatsuia symbiotica]|uniref:Prepilin-type cleavage/methylation domain-containing protein n=1 Tax=Candidatus Fukatsuia symbiotica TaxID=1878942 RepID=A0A2U8I6K3_9GAMM|nr:prepilin peptidase-dependent protein [Candidatus Fukatsuia symbiotica]AWK14813.1 prepilin-type cleavage/methylation domain-containing protein [Candidatus Fukatsuia symbiotica]MEA9445151.1 prepilin peptidase-dependent protein [Candidatus Fukatsuia symbiotica]
MKSPIAIKQQGVSLIELLLVMFLVGLMVTWGRQGWYRHQQREQLVTNAQQLLAFLTRIKADADWHNHTILLWVQHSGRGCLGSREILAAACEGRTDNVFIPSGNISLSATAQNEMGFYGRRNTAQPGHFTLVNSAGRIQLVISNRGRMRLCSEDKSIAGIGRCH